MGELNAFGLTGVIILAATALWLCYQGVARRGFDTWMSFTFLTLFAIGGLYVYDFLRMPPEMRWIFVSPDEYSELLLFSGLFLLAVSCGETLGNRTARRSNRRPPSYERPALYVEIAVVLFFIGALAMAAFISQSGGFVAKYSAVHGASANFTTAYLYRLPLSLFTAVFILMVHRLSGRKMTDTIKLLIILGTVFLLFDAFTQGKRGNTIRVILLIIVPLFIFGHLTRSRQLPALVLVSTAVIFLNFLPYLRQATSIATLGNFGEMVRSLPELADKSDRIAEGKVFLEGKHVIFAANTLNAATQQSNHNYGERWMFPIVNLIPRAIWPNKPSRYDLGITTYDLFDSSENFLIPSGSHTGGMVESYIEWGEFVFLFWILFGFIGGWLTYKARAIKGYFHSTMLFGFYSFYVQFLLQDTVAGILFWIFTIGPFLTLRGVFVLFPRNQKSKVDATSPQMRLIN